MILETLDNLDMRELGQQLQHARKKRGLTQAEAAETIGASRTTITAIEKGERRLKANELVALVRRYGRAVSEFVVQRPTIEPFEVQFRTALQKGTGEAENVILEWEDLCRNYLELEEIVGSPLAKNYPPEYRIEAGSVDATAQSIAISERNRLGLGDGPIPLLRDMLEQEVGLRIFFLSMPNGVSEMYGYDEILGGCMAICLQHPEERRRWSLAHGYLHFLAHRRKPILHYEDQYRRKPASEYLADAFATHFLMPSSGLYKRFSAYRQDGRFTPADLCTLAHYYGVAVEAMVYRLEGLELLPTGTWEKLKNRGFRVRKAQEELGLKKLPERADRLPLHYQHLAIEAFDQGLITEGRFARLLGLNRLDARRVAEDLRLHSTGMDQDVSALDLSAIEA